MHMLQTKEPALELQPFEIKKRYLIFIKLIIYQQVLTTVGKAKELTLEWGSGEPAIAIATDWLMVPLSGSLSSPSAKA